MSFTLPSSDVLRKLFSLLDEKDIAEMTEQFDADVARANNTERKHQESVNKKMKYSNETKRDVLEKLMENYAEVSDAYTYETGRPYFHDETNYLDEYDSALPDDIPVIPKAVGGLIKRLKSKPDSTLFDAVDVDHMVYEYGYKWRQAVDNANWIDVHADTFARAWLLGVWRVEKTGEVVKLEAAK